MEQDEQKIRKELWSAIPILGGAVLIPLLASFSVFMPEIDKPEIWFQRSGAVSVFLVLVSEYGLWLIDGLINPTGVIVNHQAELRNKYKNKFKAAKYIGAIIAAFATIIWGYGDLIWLAANA